jgi:hypothetical protein
MRDLKDPETGQVPKEDALEMYQEWKNKQKGAASCALLEMLIPWWATPSSLGAPACELKGTCNVPTSPH